MADAKKNAGFLPYLPYLIVILALSAGAALLLPVYRKHQKKCAELAELRHQLANKQMVGAELNRDVGALQTSPGAVEKVAREKFGLCREGETVYKYSQSDVR